MNFEPAEGPVGDVLTADVSFALTARANIFIVKNI